MDNTGFNKPFPLRDPNKITPPMPDKVTPPADNKIHIDLDDTGPSASFQSEQPMPSLGKTIGPTVSSPTRITGVKTFIAKLHVGSIGFLDEQIVHWLKENPGIIIKHTNTATGIVEGKKNEPHIIATVWY